MIIFTRDAVDTELGEIGCLNRNALYRSGDKIELVRGPGLIAEVRYFSKMASDGRFHLTAEIVVRIS